MSNESRRPLDGGITALPASTEAHHACAFPCPECDPAHVDTPSLSQLDALASAVIAAEDAYHMCPHDATTEAACELLDALSDARRAYRNAFTPPTVLALLARVRVAEQAVSGFRECELTAFDRRPPESPNHVRFTVDVPIDPDRITGWHLGDKMLLGAATSPTGSER